MPKYGWNDRATHVACAELDLSPAAHRIVTPAALIHHSMRTWNTQALRIVDDSNFGGSKGIKAKVGFAIKTRLEREVEFIDTWAEAMRVGAEPSNLSATSSGDTRQLSCCGSSATRSGGAAETLPLTTTTTPRESSSTRHTPPLNCTY